MAQCLLVIAPSDLQQGIVMTGILFLGIILIWIVMNIRISISVGNLVKNTNIQVFIKVVAFIFLITLPFIDEIFGKYQFEALCKKNGIESADVSKARGKNLKVEYGGRLLVHGTILPIEESDVWFRDADTGDVLIKHKNYYAEGGWLMRNTWLSLGSNHPMLFSGSTCDLRIEQEVFKTNLITFLYK